MSTRRNVIRLALVAASIAAATVGSAAAHDGDHALLVPPDWLGKQAPAVAPAGKSPAQVLAYWTSERMKQARPVKRLSGTHGWQFSGGEEQASRPLVAGGAPGVSGPRLRTTAAAPTLSPTPSGARALRPHGVRGVQHSPTYALPVTSFDVGWDPRVVRIYSNGGRCSGTVIARDIVLTAAHCIWSGGWVGNWAVVPGQWGTQAPYGAWAARDATVWPFYQSTGFTPYDYGFLVMAPNGQGQHIGDVVGTIPFVYNLPIALNQTYFWEFGYPAAGFFSQWGGNYPFWCWSPYSDYAEVTYQGYYEIGMGCYQTGGASGGPKFASWQGSWYVASVVSHGQDSDLGVQPRDPNYYGINEYGPYFNTDTNTLFNFALTL